MELYWWEKEWQAEPKQPLRTARRACRPMQHQLAEAVGAVRQLWIGS